MSKRETMNEILYKIFRGHEIHEKSWTGGTYSKTMEESMIEACGGDETEGYTLYLMGHESMFNDLQLMAPHYGVGYREHSRPGEIVRDIPEAPSLKHEWDMETEEWFLPDLTKYNDPIECKELM